MIDINDIEKQVQAAIAQKIEAQLSTYDLYNVIEQQINRTVQDKVNVTITGLLNRLVNSDSIAQQVNSLVTNELQEKVDLAVKARASQTVTQVDLGTEISKRIGLFVEERMRQATLPENFIPASSINWNNQQLPADCIGNGTIKNFTSEGIEDRASEVNLTVLDGQVVVENETVTKTLTVVENATVKNLSVSKLTINDELVIKSGKFVEEIKSLIDGRIDHYRNKPIDLNGGALASNQVKLIDSKSLGPSIVESNLRKLGRLQDLTVIGETNLAQTVYIDHGRLGINTIEPAGVFTAWDEESELTIRKYKQRTMYVGSSRDSELVLGVNGDAVLAVRKHGVEVNSVKIGNITVSNVNGEPSHRGSPGDLAINSATVAGQPWAWRCTGGETWVPLT